MGYIYWKVALELEGGGQEHHWQNNMISCGMSRSVTLIHLPVHPFVLSTHCVVAAVCATDSAVSHRTDQPTTRECYWQATARRHCHCTLLQVPNNGNWFAKLRKFTNNLKKNDNGRCVTISHDNCNDVFSSFGVSEMFSMYHCVLTLAMVFV